MNKQELLEDLVNRDWVDGIISSEPELRETKPNGDKWYMVNILEVVGKAAIYRNIHFYVLNEGTPTERAYYKDIEPRASITEPEE